MLRYIVGKAASGKTNTVLQKIKSDAEKNIPSILLVPEQYSFNSECNVLEVLGDNLSQYCTVLSFSSLAETVSYITGGNCKEVLNDADKIIFMSRTLKELKDTLPVFKRYISSSRFAAKVVDMIGEFKISAITPEMLENAAEQLTDGALKTKLGALALIWRAYDAETEKRFVDPADKLTVLYRQLKNSNYFSGKNVYIDGFLGFTGQQKKIIENILTKANSLTVTALCDTLENDTLDIFYNSRQTAREIKNLAKKHAVKVCEDIVLKETFYNTEEMKCVEKALSLGANEFNKETKNVLFCSSKSIEEETAFATTLIKKLVRERGYRYKDFAVIVRDGQKYASEFLRWAQKNNIPCFTDNRESLATTPVYRLISSALLAVNGFSTADILTFLKTGLVDGFDTENTSVLENYVYLWTVDSKAWLNDFTMDPDGLKVKENADEDDIKNRLCEINELRVKAITPLLNLKQRLNGTINDMCKAVFLLLKDCKTDKRMGEFLKELPKEVTAEQIDVFRQSYDIVLSVLDSLCKCYGEYSLNTEEFIEACKISAETTTVGRIPQLIDQVTLASADRFCPSDVKVAVILGANQGVFPALPQNISLIGDNERKKLAMVGLNLRDKTISATIEENLLLYSSVCCARDMVAISYLSNEESGEKSGFVTRLQNVFTGAENINYPSANYLPETENAAFDLLCRQENENTLKSSLKEALLNGEYGKKYNDALIITAQGEQKLTTETAKALYGSNIYCSATKFDTFFRCRFRYFCRYGLKTERFQPATLDVMQRGTLVHFVLEQFINRHLIDIKTVSKETVIKETDEFCDKYFSLIKGSKSIMTPRFIFLLRKIKEGIIDVLLHIVKEFAQSEFMPDGCEVTIKSGEAIEPVEFNFTGGKLSLFGSIDRLDISGNYVRIVDYKTGTKTFKLSDTLYGQNMQMLLYLYAVIRGSNNRYNTKKPAGILYIPSKNDIKKEGLAANGLLCNNLNVVKAMDSDLNGEFVPKFKINKDGTPSKSNNSFVEEEDFNAIFDYIEVLANEMGTSLLSGDIAVEPIDTSTDACSYCDYKAICGIEDKPHTVTEKLNNSEVISKMKGGKEGEI